MEPELIIEDKEGVRAIYFNRPHLKNAINKEIYERTREALYEANEDDSINIVVVGGKGEYFSSGNDMADTSYQLEPDKSWDKIIMNFIQAFIDCKKPVIGIVDGGAIGIGCTILALCDSVYASDKAFFKTPFTSIGLSPEGCSTLTFPLIMGFAKANEMLLFGQKLSAEEAYNCGFISKVFDARDFEREVWTRIREYVKLPIKSLMYSKELIRNAEKKRLLHQVNQDEWVVLLERFHSDDFTNFLIKFYERKAKI